MRIYNTYILTISLSMLLTTVILIALGLAAIDVYYTIYIAEALVITELYVCFNSKARRGLTFTGIILFTGFLFALVIQVIKILS